MSANLIELESELGRACALVGEVVADRERGSRSSIAGTVDEDLLAAVEDAESTVAQWLDAVRGA